MNHLRKSFFLITILFVGFFLTFPAVSTYGQWASTYGGIGYDSASSIQQTQDGGYIVAGGTASFGAGYNDAWLIKLDSTGEAAWQKTYGGENYDTAYTIQQTQDGGYIMGGYTDSFGAGGRDAWILKLDNTGAATWQKTYGSTGNDYVDSMQQTSDGGYIVAGDSDSIGSEKYNAWVMKLDGAGLVTWQKTYGSINSITPTCIQQTQDGGYIVAGYTDSFGAGYNDAWVMKLDGAGLVTWQKAYGGTDSDYAYFIQQTQDGGYIVAGGTASFGAGNIDVWILKLDGAGLVTWQKTYGSTDYDTPTSIRQTQDGGYIVAGGTASFGAGDRDIWVMKLGTTGEVSWQKTYGSINYDHALSIQRTQDGGYIAAGVNHSSITHSSDAFILKLDSSGSAGSCPFEGVSTAVISDTAVTGVDTTVVPADTGVTGVDTAATVSDSSASASQWCPLTGDAQRLKAGITRKKKGEGSILSAEGLLACPGTCQENYNKGLTVTLTASPSDLSTFLGWKPASLECEGTDPCQVTMDKKKSVKAVFQGPNKLKVVTTFKNKAAGSVSSGDALINCPVDCNEQYILNAPVTLTATAGDGSTFVKWTGRPCKDELTNICNFTMDKNATVKAIFQKNPE